MPELYYIEDDPSIAKSVRDFLEERGFRITVFQTIQTAREAFLTGVPVLALVDWNMPDGRGDVFLRWLRGRFPGLPVIFLTVRGDTRDVVAGFQNGADDYVVKPFELEVLYSRIMAVLRRTGGAAVRYLSLGGVTVDRERRTASDGERELPLSPAEYRLLLFLMENQGKTLTREQILAYVWDVEGNYVNDNTLTVTVKRLREKLPRPGCLKTVRSVGYRMEADL